MSPLIAFGAKETKVNLALVGVFNRLNHELTAFKVHQICDSSPG